MLKEELNIKDGLSPNGYVVIEDKDGHIIFKGHNMVVKEGRQIVMSKILNGISGKYTGQINKDDIDSALFDYNFYGIYLSSKTDETTFEADINSIKDADSISGSYFKEFGKDTGVPISNAVINSDDLSISFKITFSTDSSNTTKTTLNSLGIIMKNSENKLKLFSRICFDTIPLQLGSSYTLTYYLYF